MTPAPRNESRGRGHRIAALTLLIAGLTGVSAPILVAAVSAWRAHEERVTEVEARIEGLMSRVAMREEAAKALGGMTLSDEWRAAILPDDDPARATGPFQESIRRILSSSGIRNLTTQALSPAVAPGLAQVPVAVSFEATAEDLAHALVALEAASPIHFVENLAITDPDQASRIGAETSPNMLRVDLKVIGFMTGRDAP